MHKVLSLETDLSIKLECVVGQDWVKTEFFVHKSGCQKQTNSEINKIQFISPFTTGTRVGVCPGSVGPGDSDSRSSGGNNSPGGPGKHGGPNIARSRSAQSLKLLGEAGSAEDKLTILAQAFWLAVS